MNQAFVVTNFKITSQLNFFVQNVRQFTIKRYSFQNYFLVKIEVFSRGKFYHF